MDPDRKWTSTRAVLLAAAGQNCWPPAGNYMAATGQDLMAADTKPLPSGRQIGVLGCVGDPSATGPEMSMIGTSGQLR